MSSEIIVAFRQLSVSPGTRLGPYEILAAIGAGGMGEVYRARDTKLNRDVAIKAMERDATGGWRAGTPAVFQSTPASGGVPTFAPDGKWIAFNSNEAGANYEIYVRPFPGPGGKWRISSGGGTYPRWSPPTHEVLFLNPYDPNPVKIMAAPYAVSGGSFRADKARPWSPISVQGVSPTNGPYDLHPDGQRIAAAPLPDQASLRQDHVVFIFNFPQYLATLAPKT